MLLTSSDDWDASFPDEMFNFGSQFIYQDGYFDQLDPNSLMIVLWKMQKQVDSLEARLITLEK